MFLVSLRLLGPGSPLKKWMAGVFTVNSSPQSIKTRGWRNNARMFVEPEIDASDLMRCGHNRAFQTWSPRTQGHQTRTKTEI
jgi:hypothetical protein